MGNHGQGPKDRFVRRYWRWRRGKARKVASHLKGGRHRFRLRRSRDQLNFGF